MEDYVCPSAMQNAEQNEGESDSVIEVEIITLIKKIVLKVEAWHKRVDAYHWISELERIMYIFTLQWFIWRVLLKVRDYYTHIFIISNKKMI